MLFALHYNNTPCFRFNDPIGIRAAVSVAGGQHTSANTYGPSLEFIEAVPVSGPNPKFEDTAQSWANQGLAAKFAKILDRHPGYNIWDAREHLRQAASFWSTGWMEANGYGRVNEQAVVGKLLPGPPVEFLAVKTHDGRGVSFTWRNFRQSDFSATVIARDDGRIIYEGSGTNFSGTPDADGERRSVTGRKTGPGKPQAHGILPEESRRRPEAWRLSNLCGVCRSGRGGPCAPAGG